MAMPSVTYLFAEHNTTVPKQMQSSLSRCPFPQLVNYAYANEGASPRSCKQAKAAK